MDEKEVKPRVIAAGCGILFVVVLFLYVLFADNVGAGNVGVVTTFGHVENGTLQPGFHLVIPLAQSINNYSTRVTAQDINGLDAASSDLQSEKIDVTVQFHVDAAKANDVLQKIGDQQAITDKLITPGLSSALKATTPLWAAEDTPAHRTDIGDKTKALLQAQVVTYGVFIDNILLKNVGFSDSYTKAIEAKAVAQQNLEKSKIELEQQNVDSQKQVVDAQAQAQANNLRNASITPQLIQYIIWSKWDGKLPLYTGSGSTLLPLPPAN